MQELSAPDDWPSVTVVVPSRDRPDLLARAVRSVLFQDYPGPVECIVVLDGEDVPTPPIPESHPGPRTVRTMRNPRPTGPAAARNAGAEAAKGDLLAFLDDDDEWLPMKLTSQVSALRRWPHVPVVTTGITIVYERRSVPRMPTDGMATLRDLLRSRRSDMHTSTILVSRDHYVGTIGPMDEKIPGARAEEYDWLLRAARQGPLRTIPTPLVNVFWNPSSWFTHNWETLPAALTYLLERHPEFESERRGLARIYGQIAFAHAASRARSESMKCVIRTLGLNWMQPRAYLALLVNLGIPARRVVQALNRFGRSI